MRSSDGANLKAEDRGRVPSGMGRSLTTSSLPGFAGIRSAALVRLSPQSHRVHLNSNETGPTSAEVVRRAIRGARRVLGTASGRFRSRQPRAMARALPKTRAGIRDRAILLVGFAAALRPIRTRRAPRRGHRYRSSVSISVARKRTQRPGRGDRTLCPGRRFRTG
jgi:hypothetical protein